MIKNFDDSSAPNIASNAYIAENASIVGDVTIGEQASVWYGAVLRADSASITIGEKTNIQDACVLHVAEGRPLVVEDHVVVGHGAILHACTVEKNCLIGMGAILLNGCHIGEGSVIAAGSLITEGTVIPPASLVMGVPGKVRSRLSPEKAEAHRRGAEEYADLAEKHFGRYRQK